MITVLSGFFYYEQKLTAGIIDLLILSFYLDNFKWIIRNTNKYAIDEITIRRISN